MKIKKTAGNGPAIPDHIAAGADVARWAPDEYARLRGAVVLPPADAAADLIRDAKVVAHIRYRDALQAWTKSEGLRRRPGGITTIPFLGSVKGNASI